MAINIIMDESHIVDKNEARSHLFQVTEGIDWYLLCLNTTATERTWRAHPSFTETTIYTANVLIPLTSVGIQAALG